MRKKMIISMTGLAMACAMLTGCQIGNTDVVFDVKHTNKHVAFAVNGTECSVKEAKLYLCNYRNLYGNEYGVNLWDYDFGENSLDEYVKEVTVDEATRITCMSLLAEEQEIALTEDEKKLAESAAAEYFDSLNDEEKSFMGLSQAEIKQIYEKYALANKLYSSMTAGVDSEVSDDEARVMSIQQIIVSDEDKADQIETALQSGDDFTSLAGSYNEAGSVEASIARDTYPEEVEAVAFELENDEISGKIAASDGRFYFIKCINKFDEELTEKNKEHILEKREKEKFFDAYNDFVDSAEFELNTELWDTVSLADEKDITTDSFFKVYDKFFAGGN